MSATTLEVDASTTLVAETRPVSVPAIMAVSASTEPITVPVSPMVSCLATTSPLTMPETCTSPAVVMSPVIFRSTLRIEGADAARPLLAVDLNNALPHFQKFRRIDRLAVDDHFVMEMRARAAARAAEFADFLMRGHALTHRHGDPVQVGIVGHDAHAVIDLDEFAVTVPNAREGDDARCGAIDRGAEFRREIDAGMKPFAAVDRIDARPERTHLLVVHQRGGQREGVQQLAENFLALDHIPVRRDLAAVEGDIGTAFTPRRIHQLP